MKSTGSEDSDAMQRVDHNSDIRPAPPVSTTRRVIQWLQDPLGSIIAASAATLGSVGLVVSGIWAINLALN